MSQGASRPLSRATCAALGAVACWLFVAGLRSQSCAIVDDAFITFRYVDNLQLGHGLAWNAGEPPAEGASNLTMVGLLALFGEHATMITVARAIGVLSALATALGIGLAMQGRASATARWLAASVFLVLQATAVHAQAGLETSLYACALTWLVVALARAVAVRQPARLALAAAAYAFAMLSRPEAGVIAGTGLVAWLGLELIVRKDKHAARTALGLGVACAGLLALVLAWKLWYFGTLLSPPYWVKAGGGGRALPGARYVALFVRDYGVIWLAALAGALTARRDVITWIAGAIALANTAFFVFTAPLVAFEARYLYPALPLLLMLAAPAIDRLLARVPAPAQLALAPLSLVVLAASSLRSSEPLWRLDRLALQDQGGSCALTWTGRDRQLGLRLASIDPSGTLRIAAEDAGAVAFYSRAPVLDLIGLTNEAIARASTHEAFLDHVLAFRPDIVLMRLNADGSSPPGGSGHGALGRFGKGTLLEDTRFTAAYREVAAGSSGGAIYRWHAWGRVDAARHGALFKLAGYEAEPLR